MRRFPALLVAASLSGPPAPPAEPPPRTGVELIQRMRQRYDGKWYRTLTFTQKTTLPNGRVEIWREALSAPGMLRIDAEPLDSMNTMIFRGDSIYDFRGGKLLRSKPMIHPLMVLAYEVYLQPPAETVRKLESLAFDLSKLHQTSWQGRPTYVVGADARDSTSPQFWIDQERLYLVRSLEPSQKHPSTMLDTRFERFRAVDEAWLETEVVFLVGGEVKMREEYSEVRAGVELDPALFQTGVWTPPTWLRAGPGEP